MADREEKVYKAKLAEQAERYDEMVEEMKQVAKQDQDLTIEERNLLSVAYKNVIGARRASWRIVSSIEQKEKDKSAKDDRKIGLMERYREKIENELTTICDEVLDLLKDHLIPSAGVDEPEVFYKKMMGDYYRYKAEIADPDSKLKIAEQSLQKYQEALEASKKLSTIHPIRLGLALNFSVFYYEIMNNPHNACRLAKNAFDDAVKELDEVPDPSYKDSTLILQLLRDNLTLWTSDEASQEQVEDIEDEK